MFLTPVCEDRRFLFLREGEVKQTGIRFCVDFLQDFIAKGSAQMRHRVVVVARVVFQPFVVGEVEHSLFLKP